MSALHWVLSAIGVLGVGGFIALIVLAPAVAAQVASAVAKLLKWMLSTRIGVGILVGIACLLGGWLYGDHLGSSRTQANWDAARESAAAEKASREKEIADKAKTEERTIIADERAADKKAIEDLNAQLSKLATDQCTLSDEFIEWLRTH